MKRTRTALVSVAIVVASPIVGLISPTGAQVAAASPTPAPSLPALPTSLPPAAVGTNTSATVTFTRTEPASSQSGATPAQSDTFSCSTSVDNPHESTHVPGTINTVVTVTCGVPMTAESVTAHLYLDGSLVASGSKTTSLKTKTQANAAIACTSGTFVGAGAVAVVPPAGYSPSSWAWAGYSAAIPDPCSTIIV